MFTFPYPVLLVAITFDCSKWANISCCNPTFFKACPHSITMCKLPCCLNGWPRTWWHLDVCMGKLMFLSIIIYVLFVHIIYFGCFHHQFNGAWDVIKPFISYLMCHNITTLIIPTWKRLHNWCAWNSKDALASILGKKFSNPSSIHDANRTFFGILKLNLAHHATLSHNFVTSTV